VCWHSKTRLESGPVTADLTTTVVHDSKLLINDVKPDHSLIYKNKFIIEITSYDDIFFIVHSGKKLLTVSGSMQSYFRKSAGVPTAAMTLHSSLIYSINITYIFQFKDIG